MIDLIWPYMKMQDQGGYNKRNVADFSIFQPIQLHLATGDHVTLSIGVVLPRILGRKCCLRVIMTVVFRLSVTLAIGRREGLSLV